MSPRTFCSGNYIYGPRQNPLGCPSLGTGFTICRRFSHGEEFHLLPHTSQRVSHLSRSRTVQRQRLGQLLSFFRLFSGEGFQEAPRTTGQVLPKRPSGPQSSQGKRALFPPNCKFGPLTPPLLLRGARSAFRTDAKTFSRYQQVFGKTPTLLFRVSPQTRKHFSCYQFGSGALPLVD